MTALQRWSMLRVHVELFVARRGVATLVMLLTGVAVLMWLAWTLWAQRLAVAEVQARLDVAASASQAALRAGHAPAVGVAAKVSPGAGFVESLPQSDAQLGQIQTILRSAASSGLRAPQADFQTVREAHGAFESVQMSVLLEGRYNAVRRWLDEVLKALPNVSVDALQFERETTATTDIKVKARLSLWLRTHRDEADATTPPAIAAAREEVVR